ncbi:MAG: hypothetical protein ACRC33_14585 [Gemmataceae bacterium]
MNLVARVLIALACLTACAGLLLGLGGGVGVWLVKGPLTDKAAGLFGKADAALDKADRGIALVTASLANAAERLDAARREASREPTNALARRLMARTVQQTVAPMLGDAHLILTDVAEAAVVVKSVLEVAADSQDLEGTALDASRLLRLKGQLAGVAPAAWELSRLLGDGGPDADIDAQYTRVEQILRAARQMAEEYGAQLAEIRGRARDAAARARGWLTPAATLLSAACFWVALSQVSVLAHARSWWKRLGREGQ